MLSIMTYNVGENIKDNLSLFINIIKTISPDILLLNEASWLIQKPILDKLTTDLKFPHYCFAKSNNTPNDTLLLSKYPFKDVVTLDGFQNSAIASVVKIRDKDISIAGVHLSPNSENVRVSEISKVMDRQGKYKFKIILGDLNSISPENLVRIKRSGKIYVESAQYDVIKKIRDGKYFDSAICTKQDKNPTVLSTKDDSTEYVDLRLDYIFISDTLKDGLLKYKVIINKLTKICSDHYPVLVHIK